MKPFLKGLGAVAVVAFLIVVSSGVVIFLASMLRSATRWFFNGVNSTVTAAIVAGVATTVVSVFTVVIGRYLERRSAIEAEIRTSKIPVYNELVTRAPDIAMALRSPAGG